MALGPEDLEAYGEKDRQEADRLEGIIDRLLKKERSSIMDKKKFSLTISNAGSVDAPNKTVKAEIDRRYKAAGWESAKITHSYVSRYNDGYWHLGVTMTRKHRRE